MNKQQQKEELQKVKEHIDNQPLIHDPTIQMDFPNEVLKMHTGIFHLQSQDGKIIIDGEIAFKWFPEMRVSFSGTGSNIYDPHLFDNNRFDLIVENSNLGKVLITTASSGKEPHIEGFVNDYTVIGDKSIPVEKVRFSVLNLFPFIGQNVRYQRGEKEGLSSSRIILKVDNITINVDCLVDHTVKLRSLKSEGGYLALGGGEIIIRGSHIVLSEIGDLLKAINSFLTFLNGRRISIIFLRGLFNEEPKWMDYSPYHNDMYKGITRWIPQKFDKELYSLWENFYFLWKNLHDKEFLRTILHWYVECNGHAGMTEGSLVMAQTALELIYNWWVIEKKKVLMDENLSAANKIRLIISDLNITYSIPKHFTELNKYVQTNNISDGPEVIVYIRNAIVHSNHEKRLKHSQIDYKARYEALQLSIWYIELSILKILQYSGIYANRCLKGEYVGENEILVPWANNT